MFIRSRANKNDCRHGGGRGVHATLVQSAFGSPFYDFWVPEMNYKYVEVLPKNPDRYYEELIHKFESPVRTSIYSISFIFLALHLLHGFSSSFKTVGVDSKYYNIIKSFTFIFSIAIPLGFIFIALFHNLTH